MAVLNVKNLPDDRQARPARIPGAEEGRARQCRSAQPSGVLGAFDGLVEQPQQASILELEGLGKELWEGIDPAEYIEQERASWE